MKQQMVNPNKVSQIDMMNNSSQMGMMSLMQKLGKGKRKFDIKLQKTSKKFLGQISTEMKKQMAVYGANPQTKGVVDFFDYLIVESKSTSEVLKLSYEELDFLRSMLSNSANQMDGIKFKWYQFWKKFAVKMMAKQYKLLAEEVNK